jgi:hypothetical protein
MIESDRFGEKKGSCPGHAWAWDFIHDWTLKGGSCRILSVVDEYTRQAHCLNRDQMWTLTEARVAIEDCHWKYND